MALTRLLWLTSLFAVVCSACTHVGPPTPVAASDAATSTTADAGGVPDSAKTDAAAAADVHSDAALATSDEPSATDAAGCAQDGDCDDSNPATLDHCVQILGTCSHIPDPHWVPCDSVAKCDDQNPCTTQECLNGQCMWTAIDLCCHATAECDDGVSGTIDYCLENEHVCGHLGGINEPCENSGNCEYINVCVTDSCVSGKCHHDPVPNCCFGDFDCKSPAPCSFGACVANQCVQTVGFACNDGDACTDDSLNMPACSCTFAATKSCTGAPCSSSSECNDANPCTLDACGPNGGCVWTTISGCAACPPLGCEDDDPATYNTCDPMGGCQFVPIPK
jgi:hypothetical protein